MRDRRGTFEREDQVDDGKEHSALAKPGTRAHLQDLWKGRRLGRCEEAHRGAPHHRSHAHLQLLLEELQIFQQPGLTQVTNA